MGMKRVASSLLSTGGLSVMYMRGDVDESYGLEALWLHARICHGEVLGYRAWTGCCPFEHQRQACTEILCSPGRGAQRREPMRDTEDIRPTQAASHRRPEADAAIQSLRHRYIQATAL